MAGVYLHIPFCKSRCSYCDFYSTVGRGDAERYVRAVVAEAGLRSSELGGEAITTLYVGGGTPSQLPATLMRDMLDGIRTALHIGSVDELTIEVNPDDVDAPYVASLVAMGVNRVSMGVQSLDDDQLRAVGRRHTAQQAVQAVDVIRHAGIDNVSVDLIFGLPGQTLESWQRSLQGIVDMRPEHISAYGLSYEPGTALWRRLQNGEVHEVDEEVCLLMYDHLLCTTAEAGYEHYEISNFALPQHRSRHNSAYWTGIPYLGLGAAAHSFDGIARRSNPRDIDAYMTAIEGGGTAYQTEVLGTQERFDERVMVALRTCEGLDLNALAADFGEDALNRLTHAARPHIDAGRLRQQNGHIVLSKSGIMTSDDIISDLMA